MTGAFDINLWLVEQGARQPRVRSSTDKETEQPTHVSGRCWIISSSASSSVKEDIDIHIAANVSYSIVQGTSTFLGHNAPDSLPCLVTC